jgi:hypothetical protein
VDEDIDVGIAQCVEPFLRVVERHALGLWHLRLDESSAKTRTLITDWRVGELEVDQSWKTADALRSNHCHLTGGKDWEVGGQAERVELVAGQRRKGQVDATAAQGVDHAQVGQLE